MKKKKTICLAASSGGHYEQLMMLKPLLDKYDGFILTEQTAYKAEEDGYKMHYVLQVNREELSCWPRMVANSFISLGVYLKERPKVVICTGALAMIPMCLIVKIFGGKLIFIESFAKITSPSRTGKFLYRFADRFYVQWKTMKKFYPKAKYLGGIY